MPVRVFEQRERLGAERERDGRRGARRDRVAGAAERHRLEDADHARAAVHAASRGQTLGEPRAEHAATVIARPAAAACEPDPCAVVALSRARRDDRGAQRRGASRGRGRARRGQGQGVGLGGAARALRAPVRAVRAGGARAASCAFAVFVFFGRRRGSGRELVRADVPGAGGGALQRLARAAVVGVLAEPLQRRARAPRAEVDAGSDARRAFARGRVGEGLAGRVAVRLGLRGRQQQVVAFFDLHRVELVRAGPGGHFAVADAEVVLDHDERHLIAAVALLDARPAPAEAGAFERVVEEPVFAVVVFLGFDLERVALHVQVHVVPHVLFAAGEEARLALGVAVVARAVDHVVVDVDRRAVQAFGFGVVELDHVRVVFALIAFGKFGVAAVFEPIPGDDPAAAAGEVHVVHVLDRVVERVGHAPDAFHPRSAVWRRRFRRNPFDRAVLHHRFALRRGVRPVAADDRRAAAAFRFAVGLVRGHLVEFVADGEVVDDHVVDRDVLARFVFAFVFGGGFPGDDGAGPVGRGLGVGPADEVDAFDRDVVVVADVHERVVFAAAFVRAAGGDFFVVGVEDRAFVASARIPRFVHAVHVGVAGFAGPGAAFGRRQRQRAVRPGDAPLEDEVVAGFVRVAGAEPVHARGALPRFALGRAAVGFAARGIADVERAVGRRARVAARARARSERVRRRQREQRDRRGQAHQHRSPAHHSAASERARRRARSRRAPFRRAPSLLFATHALAALDAATRALRTAL